MSLVFIGLGSNVGDGRENLLSAWKQLGAVKNIRILTLSSPYFSEPVAVDCDHWFTNAVGVLETKIAPEELLRILLGIEAGMGRDRAAGPDRCIDMDILYYDDLILSTENLEIPHPEMYKRLFVLVPLAELAPDHLHPILGRTTAQLQSRFVECQDLRKISWGKP